MQIPSLRPRWLGAIVAIAAMWVGACSSDSEEGTPCACTAGAETACTCADGRDGVQTCSADCTGYSACVCSGDGGTGGTSGAAGNGGGGTGGGDAGTGGSAGAAGSVTCPNATGGPEMVILGSGFCIDATEVTRGQYDQWLATNPATDGQPTQCAWNTSFDPDIACMAGSRICDTDCDDQPQPCVDWCDAYAFCEGVGKRLCGKIGGGANDYDAHSDPDESQWFAACASGDAYSEYPYGTPYDPQACNGIDKGNTTTVVVGTLSGCQSTVSGYEGVHDLSGNLWEWEDSCDANAGDSDNCQLRGGSFNEDSQPLRCVGGIGRARNLVFDMIGFRCCGP